MEDANEKSVQIHYIKNKTYRSIYSDGAIGGVTPLGQINLCFYATRNAIPKAINYKLEADGKLGKVLGMSEDSKSGVVREIELGVYMNKQTAREIYEFFKLVFDDKK